jgi:pilus assembly protein CpaF
VITLQDVFLFDFAAGVDEEGKFRGSLKPTGLRPTFLDKLQEHGIALDPALFAPEARGGR